MLVGDFMPNSTESNAKSKFEMIWISDLEKKKKKNSSNDGELKMIFSPF